MARGRETDNSEPPRDPVRYLDLDKPARRHEIVHVILHAVITWALLLLVYAVAPLNGVFGGGEVVRCVVAVLVLTLVSIREARAIVRSRIPQSRAIMALSTMAAMLVVVFSSLYLGLETSQPGSFTEGLGHIGSLYFTITTLTSVGFGDISPVTDLARVIVSVQMLFDLILLGGIVRILAQAARRTLTNADRRAEEAGR
jgi:hypothetical protein